jgi:hypothetical protein
MSSYEQKIQPPDKRWQYLLLAAEPYETIAFKIPAREIDRSEDKYWSLWNKESKQVAARFTFVKKLKYSSTSCNLHSSRFKRMQISSVIFNLTQVVLS